MAIDKNDRRRAWGGVVGHIFTKKRTKHKKYGYTYKKKSVIIRQILNSLGKD